MRSLILDFFKKGGVGAEIGVWRGDFSAQILKQIRPKRLYLVDPWMFMPQYPDRWYGGSTANNQADMDQIFIEVQKRFRTEDVVIVRGTIEDLSDALDFIYIDGNHSYEWVKADLIRSLNLVKLNGIISGDDYNNSDAVATAVHDFYNEHTLKVSKPQIIGGQFVFTRL